MSGPFTLPKTAKPFVLPKPTPEQRVKNLLVNYERAELALAEFRRVNAAVLDELAEKEEARDSLEKEITGLLLSLPRPDDIKEDGKRTHVFGSTDFFRCQVTFKKQSDYYDIAALPLDILSVPGVVKDVDDKKIDELLNTYVGAEDIRAAKKAGDWMKPIVTLKRNEKEQKE